MRFVKVREATGMVRSPRNAALHAPTSELSSMIESLCEQAPEEAFDFAVDMLTNVANALSTLVDESSVSLGKIQSTGERLERLNEENKRRLAELIAG